MAEIAFGSATELAAAIRAGQVGSRELLDLYLERIERLNPAINAVVTLDVERARQAAGAADDALARGEEIGPLHGVPMTVKDTIETAGLRTTAGAPELSDHVPDRDADAVALLRAAGAVVFGKTNAPLYAGDAQSYNEIFGTTNNPWDPGRGPGGSSGGAAAALAAGLTGLELGSDIGGSIRNPAHYCGVFGHKPTYGIIPTRGHIPAAPGSLGRADVGALGPMGRSAADLALGLDVLAGPSGPDAAAWQLHLPGARAGSLPDYRIAAWLDDPACPVDREVGAVLDAAVDELRRAGAKVDDGARPDISFTEAADLFQTLVFSVMGSGVPPELFDAMCQAAASPPSADEPAMAALARAVTIRHREWLGANERRHRQRSRWAEFFLHHDVLLCPVASTAAFPHDHTEPQFVRTLEVNGEQRSYLEATLLWNGIVGVVYLPAAVVPVGRTAQGLPVGIQVVGPYLEDRTVVDVAARISEVVGGFEVPPGF